MHNLLLYYSRFFFGHSACTTCNLRNQCGITISSANQDLDCLDTRLPALLAQVPRDITRRVDRVIWKLLVIAVTLFMLMCVQLWSVAASRVTGTTPKHPRTGSPHRSPKGEFAVFSLQPWGWNQLFKQVYQSVKTISNLNNSPKGSRIVLKHLETTVLGFHQLRPLVLGVVYWYTTNMGCKCKYIRIYNMYIYLHFTICINMYSYTVYTHIFNSTFPWIFPRQHFVRHWLVWPLWALPLQLSSWVLLLWHQWWHGRSETWTTCTVRI